MMLKDNITFDAKKITKYFRNQAPFEGGNNLQFTDPEFPPDKKSLMSLDSSFTPIDQEAYDKSKADLNPDAIEWKRANEILPEYELFVGKIEADDIKQGSLGNCYFLSALAAITEYPQLVSRLIRTDGKRLNGYYEVVLFIDGEWQIVIIDDFFPVSKNDNKLIFCKPNMNEIWAILLEKAWAKVNSGYLNTIGGLCGEVLHVLTGFPYQGFDLNQMAKEDVWETLYTAYKSNHVIGTGTMKMYGIDKVGLVEGHAYSVLQMEEVMRYGVKYKLLKLRNPWGKTEWKGLWSDGCEKWTPELKEQLLLKNGDDGVFWISIDEYVRYFDQADIAYMQFNSINYGHVLVDPEVIKEPLVYEISLNKDELVTFSIISSINRFNRSLKSIKKRGFTLVIAEVDPTSGKVKSLVNGKSSNREFLHHYIELKKGDYKIWIHGAGLSIPEIGRLCVKFSMTSCLTQKFIGYDRGFETLREATLVHLKENYLSIYEKKEHYCDIVPGFMSKFGYEPLFIYNNRSRPVRITYSLFMMFGLEMTPINGVNYNYNDIINIELPPKEGYPVLLVAGQYFGSPIIGISSVNSKILDKNAEIPPFNSPQIVEIQTGHFYTYYISSKTSLKFSEEFHYIGKKNLNELYKCSKFDEKIYNHLKSFENEQVNEDLLWNKYDFDTDQTYIGQVDKEGKFSGIGYIKNSFKIYIGHFKNGVKEIYGKEFLSFSPDALILTFEAEFKNGKKNGRGKEFINDQIQFDGVFFNDEKVEGIKVSGSQKWRGKFLDGKMHGKGVLLYTDIKKAIEIEYEWDQPLEDIHYSWEVESKGLTFVDYKPEEFYEI